MEQTKETKSKEENDMKKTDISTIRLNNQQIATTKFNAVKDLVGWMGVMQAQDYAMAKWAIGVRLPNTTDQAVETAITNGEILRTHLLRPTWHFVSADDIRWMLELTARRVKAFMKSSHEEHELSGTIFNKSKVIMEKALRGGNHLTREEIRVELTEAGIDNNYYRLSHLLAWAELDGLVCSGSTKEGKPTYALLEERVLKTKPLTKEEALAALAKKYFSSHSPATLQDFAWWSGLPAGDANLALELVKPDFISEEIDSQTYWSAIPFSIPKKDKEAVYFLPAYDEFIISYKDRSASLPFENHTKTVSNNGIFRPVIVVNGQVTGIWKRTIKKDKVIVETEFFKQPNQIQNSLIEKAANQFGHFIELKTEINQYFNQPD